ncbi:hypothetical protein ACHWQZ_G011727 [Mnemiopsis leidyi]
MNQTRKTASEDEEGIFKYRKKILKMKLLFVSGIGAIGVLAGFKYGYAKSKAKHGSSEIAKDKTIEDPVKFAGRALKRATFITVGCFVVGVGTISLILGVRSLTDLRNISRRKWINQNNEVELQSEDDFSPPKEENINLHELNSSNQMISNTLDNEIILDKAEELTDKWR